MQTPSAKLLEAEPHVPRGKGRYRGAEKSGPSIKPFPQFPLPWSHYVRLLGVKDAQARVFYETEALRGGWSVRQLNRQISTVFYERTALSRNKVAMLRKGQRKRPEDQIAPEEEIKDPLVLEFLGLKNEYSETTRLAGHSAHIAQHVCQLNISFALVPFLDSLNVPPRALH